MSDEFDKEAEREKLREKFARDEKKREHTQRMSELLLKGATMTNKHCDQCGDPIFRHDGREFCPTCNRPAGENDAAGSASDATSSAAGAADGTPDAASGSPEAASGSADAPQEAPTNVERSAANGTDTREASTGATNPEPGNARRTRGPGRQGGSTGDDGVGRAEAREEPDGSTSDGLAPGTVDDGSVPSTVDDGPEHGRVADVSDARASLTRTLTRFARAAEETDDPRRAREHLKAAREAAETLAALNR